MFEICPFSNKRIVSEWCWYSSSSPAAFGKQVNHAYEKTERLVLAICLSYLFIQCRGSQLLSFRNNHREILSQVTNDSIRAMKVVSSLRLRVTSFPTDDRKAYNNTHFSQAAKCPPFWCSLIVLMGCSLPIHHGGITTNSFGKQLIPIGMGE